MIKTREGKVFRRISDGFIFGNEMYLGMAYPISGDPFLELPEHYEEIDEPITEDMPLITEEEPLVATNEELMIFEELIEEPEQQILKRVTYADYRELEKKVETLIKLLNG